MQFYLSSLGCVVPDSCITLCLLWSCGNVTALEMLQQPQWICSCPIKAKLISLILNASLTELVEYVVIKVGLVKRWAMPHWHQVKELNHATHSAHAKEQSWALYTLEDFQADSEPVLHAPTIGGLGHSLVATDYFFQIILKCVVSIRLFYCSQMKWSLPNLKS